MDLMLLRAFQGQVRDQCAFVLKAAQGVDDALRRVNEGSPSPEWRIAMDDVWFSLQNLLSAAANVSKALWGQSGRLAEERRPLRESLGVGDESPLQNTDLRNHFDHFDDRLTRWWAESPTHNLIDRNIGPPTMVRIEIQTPSGTEPDIDIDRFRLLDPATGTVHFWGDAYDLRAIVRAASELLPIAAREAEKPHWETPS